MPEKRWGTCIMTLMRLSARADYALRAAIELAAASSGHVTADQLARAQQIPGKFPENITYPGVAEPLQQVWIALRANERAVLEQVTLADIVSGNLPDTIRNLTDNPSAWV